MVMRHEEYLAMAEANRKLTEENKKLKAPKLSIKRKWHMPRLNNVVESMIGFFSEYAGMIVVASILCGLVYGIYIACQYDNDRADAVFDCASISRAKNANTPLDPYYIFTHSIGKRGDYWSYINTTTSKKFDTYEDGAAYLKKMKVKECSK